MSGSGSNSLYQELGVPRDADADTLKKAFRRLAQESHPDQNPDDPQAEERFKRINQAYSVLSDPDRRAAYDEFGDIALDPNFDADRARAASSQGFGGFPGGGVSFSSGDPEGFADLGSMFENLFGGGGQGARQPRTRRGRDMETTLELDFTDAALGCEQRVDLQHPDPAGGATRSETLTVRIPAGVADGGKIRLAGKGGPGMAGGPAGDLIAKIRVRPHKLFRREGRNIHLEAPVTIAEATLGAEFEVPTLDGKVMLRVPAGTDSGSKLRLRGKGIPADGRGKPAGDLYVSIRIRVPKDLNDEDGQHLKDLEALGPPGVRDDFAG
jgi:DnaJ-class molecular chaperone